MKHDNNVLQVPDKNVESIDRDRLRLSNALYGIQPVIPEKLVNWVYLNPGVPVIPKLVINYKNTMMFEKVEED